MEDIKREEYRGHTIRIVNDDDPENPRECWDNLGEMLYTSTRYNLGDRRVNSEDIQEIIDRDDVIWLPVYALIHSGIALSTGSFADPWDSGQCGIIYVEREKAVKEFGESLDEDKVRAVLTGEVEVFGQYLGGEVYGFCVETSDGTVVNSCYGFFGYESIDEMIREAKAHVDWEVEESERAACANG